jgi:hypothetical protein
MLACDSARDAERSDAAELTVQRQIVFVRGWAEPALSVAGKERRSGRPQESAARA